LTTSLIIAKGLMTSSSFKILFLVQTQLW